MFKIFVHVDELTTLDYYIYDSIYHLQKIAVIM